MIKVNSLVVYKSSCAVVTELGDNGKFTVKYISTPATETKKAVYSTQNVRAKDVLLLCEEGNFDKALEFASRCPSAENMYNLDDKNEIAVQIKDCYEFLESDDETKNASYGFDELVSLFRPEFNSDESWGLYSALKNTVYFSQSLKDAMDGKIVFMLRSREEIDSLVKKADEKGKEAELRADFLKRLKEKKLLSEDSKFMGDVEALALGKTDKSRTMHDAGIKETPEKAHRLLLDTGIWDITRNPHPLRWGLSTKSATQGLSSPVDIERVEVDSVAYAIDSEYSTDPDDAVAFDGKYLWVHIADPASTVMPDDEIDKSARGRGATLYIPEGAARMLCENCLEDYALGLKERSRALSFRLLLDDKCNVEECSIFKTFVNVKRLSYKAAEEQKESSELKPLFEIARKNIEKRNSNGAVSMSFPEVHISVDPSTKKVSIEKYVSCESNDMIREMMLLTGEGCAKFAFQNNIPFPFISQEEPSIPADLPEGYAHDFKLRRCMRKRSVGITPGKHCGLGLSMYTQVTSPLRRYSDLLSHEQLRAFLEGRKLMDKDTMLMHLAEGDAGAMAARKAERNSNNHWTLVYLLQNPELIFDAVCIDTSGKLPQFSIPDLAFETYIPCDGAELNKVVKVKASKIDIPELTVEFSVV